MLSLILHVGAINVSHIDCHIGIIPFVSIPVMCQLREAHLHRSLVILASVWGFIRAAFSIIDQEMGTDMNKGHAQ